MAKEPSDFPILTRSGRVSPKILRVLRRVDTGRAHGVKGTGSARAQLDEATLQALPERVEQTLGADHPEFAKVLHRLAVFYHSQEKLDKAESLYRRALDIAERTLSEPNLELGLLINNLARVLHDQGNFAEEEGLYQRSLEVLQKAVGPEHPKIATPLSNLAELYLDQGKPQLARKRYEESIAILEKALGPEHPKVLKARKKLGRVPEEHRIKTIGICPECNEVITGSQPWEMFDGKAIHSRCRPGREEI